MNPNWNEQKVIKLLARLNTISPEYPVDKLANRRAAFMASISAVAVGGAIGTGISASHAAKALKGMSMIEKVIFGVQLVAVAGLTTYLGVTAYVHREDLKRLLFPSPTAVLTTPLPALVDPTSSLLPSMTVSPTPTPLVTSTLPPGVEDPQPTSPPATQPPPPTSAPTDKPGLHLGQTKTPKP